MKRASTTASSSSPATPTTCRSRHQRFPSNWELSTARAVEVAHTCVQTAEARELAPPATASTIRGAEPQRHVRDRAQNRRIEIVLVPNIVGSAADGRSDEGAERDALTRMAFALVLLAAAPLWAAARGALQRRGADALCDHAGARPRARHVRGREVIDVDVARPTARITLDAYELAIVDARVVVAGDWRSAQLERRCASDADAGTNAMKRAARLYRWNLQAGADWLLSCRRRGPPLRVHRVRAGGGAAGVPLLR